VIEVAAAESNAELVGGGTWTLNHASDRAAVRGTGGSASRSSAARPPGSRADGDLSATAHVSSAAFCYAKNEAAAQAKGVKRVRIPDRSSAGSATAKKRPTGAERRVRVNATRGESGKADFVGWRSEPRPNGRGTSRFLVTKRRHGLRRKDDLTTRHWVGFGVIAAIFGTSGAPMEIRRPRKLVTTPLSSLSAARHPRHTLLCPTRLTTVQQYQFCEVRRPLLSTAGSSPSAPARALALGWW
jgi:hypothetical protein